MKDILRIVKFDHLTSSPIAIKPFIVIMILCSLLGMIYAPLIFGYILFGAMVFVIPLQLIADKSGFNKLYGILPVNRKNITRARFIYIFLIHFFAEVYAVIFASVSTALKLYKVLPNQEGEMMQMIEESFADKLMTYGLIVGMFLFICLLFSYMEMMGQIFGRENEMKIILITMAVVSVLLIGFVMLAERDIIPAIALPKFPETTSGRITLAVVANICMFIVCLLFGEITAGRLAKREL